jgi:hypothetical protein
LEYLFTTPDLCLKVNDASVFLYRLPYHWLDEPKTGNFTTYVRGMQDLFNRRNILTDQATWNRLFTNIKAFDSLCRSISGCGTVSQQCILTSPDQVTGSGASHVGFFWIVVIVAAFFVALHMLKMLIVFVSIWNQELWLPQFSAHSISSSAFSPLFLLFGYNMRHKFIYGVLLYSSRHSDHIRHLLTEGLFVSIPLLFVNAYFWLAVVQTGLSVPNLVSLTSGGFLVPVTLVRAYRAFRLQQQGAPDATDSIRTASTSATQQTKNNESDIESMNSNVGVVEMSDFGLHPSVFTSAKHS